MNSPRSSVVFFMLLVALAAFVLVTSGGLPAVVASHFGPGGSANGFIPRATYTVIMLVLIVVLPALLAFLPSSLARGGGAKLNIPNREYWLAPERFEATAAYLGRQGKVFAAVLAAFLTYTHWLVVKANASVPVALPQPEFVVGLGAFLVIVMVWAGSLYAHFRRVGLHWSP